MLGNLYTVTDVTQAYLGANYKHKEFIKVYERVLRGIAAGEAGRVRKMPRGWLLTEANLGRLMAFMSRKWAMTLRPLAAGQEETAPAAV
jgi:hypothetical protein